MKKHDEHSGSAVRTQGAKSQTFTPGLWNPVAGSWWIAAANGAPICQINYALLDRAEADANARLIAAAPDLLAALKSYIAITKTPELNGELPVFLRDFADKARAAIAKATGAA